MPNSVKIKDVAASAGVSIATVSYVMNGKAEGLGITLATRERVLEAIRQTGYRPNRAAREMAIGCLPPAGQAQLLSCQVAELLSNDPSGQPLTTEQHNNITTLLAAAGYSLVPVTSVNDLPQLPGGMVGVVYKREVRSQELEVSWSRDALVPEVTDQAPELRDEAVPAPAEPVPEVPPQVVPPVDADLRAASVTGASPPGTDGDGTSPSTLTAEPVVGATPSSTTQQQNPSTELRAGNPTTVLPQDPIADPTWSRDALVPGVTEQAPELRDEGVPAPAEPVPEVPPQVVPPVDADLRAASVTGASPPGTDGDGTSPSTLAAEPVTVDPAAEPVVASTPPSTTQQPDNPTTVLPPPSTTQQPDNPTTVLPPPSTTEQPNNPTTVLPPEPVTAAIPDAAIVPEEAIKAPEAASEPEPAIAEEPEAEVESNEKSQV